MTSVAERVDGLDWQSARSVLDEVGAAVVGSVLDEDECARRVPVDDHVAEAEEGLLLHGADELEDGLRVDGAVRRRRELVERRDRVAERSA